MTTEQRRALADTTPTSEVIKDAVTFPRDRLGEPLDISAERFEAWLARVRRDAAREALDGLAKRATALAEGGNVGSFRIHWWTVAGLAEGYRDTRYPEETP